MLATRVQGPTWSECTFRGNISSSITESQSSFFFFWNVTPERSDVKFKPDRKKTLKKRLLACARVEGKRVSPFVVIPAPHSQLCVDRTDTGPGHNTFLLGPGKSGCYAALCSSTPQHKAATYRIMSSIQRYPERARISLTQACLLQLRERCLLVKNTFVTGHSRFNFLFGKGTYDYQNGGNKSSNPCFHCWPLEKTT